MNVYAYCKARSSSFRRQTEAIPWRTGFSELQYSGSLCLATAYVAEPYIVAWRFSATSPRTIAPRGDLAEAERSEDQAFSVRFAFGRVCFRADWLRKMFSRRAARERDSNGGSNGNGDRLGCRWARDHQLPCHQGITDQFAATFRRGVSFRFEFVGSAPNYDLAVLQLERTRDSTSSDRNREFRGSAGRPVCLRDRQSLWLGADS